jgi:hypothetical protein
MDSEPSWRHSRTQTTNQSTREQISNMEQRKQSGCDRTESAGTVMSQLISRFRGPSCSLPSAILRARKSHTLISRSRLAVGSERCVGVRNERVRRNANVDLIRNCRTGNEGLCSTQSRERDENDHTSPPLCRRGKNEKFAGKKGYPDFFLIYSIGAFLTCDQHQAIPA